jgi:hypothetical protein
VGDAQVGAALAHGSSERTEVRRADPVVDVPAVGLAPDGVHRGAGPAVDLGRGVRRRAVCAVDDERDAGERAVDRRQQMPQVVLARTVQVTDPTDAGPGRAVAVGGSGGHGALDVGLDHVGQLVPAPAEQLDPVVGHRVVAGRDHHPEVGAGAPREMGEGRRRQDARAQHVGTGAAEPSHDRGLEHLPARAGVAADDRDGTLGPVAVGQHTGGGVRDREGQFRREVGVGQTPDAVCPEQATQGTPVSACCTEAPCGPS